MNLMIGLSSKSNAGGFGSRLRGMWFPPAADMGFRVEERNAAIPKELCR
jgi:hypothetical protein